MRIVLFPFFVIWLLTQVVWSLVGMVVEAALPAIPLSTAVLCLILVGLAKPPKIQPTMTLEWFPKTALITQLQTLPPAWQPHVLTAIYNQNARLSAVDRVTFLYSVGKSPRWPEQVAYWENVSTKQPTDVNVLLNLRQLALFEGRTDDANRFNEKAKKLDPNNLIFAQQ